MDKICKMFLVQSPAIANQNCAFDKTMDDQAKILSSFKPSYLKTEGNCQYQWSFAPK